MCSLGLQFYLCIGCFQADKISSLRILIVNLYGKMYTVIIIIREFYGALSLRMFFSARTNNLCTVFDTTLMRLR